MVIMAQMEQFKGDNELEGSLLNEVHKHLVLEKKRVVMLETISCNI